MVRGLSYASGSFGKALIVGALELTALFYLTERIGASPALAGTALFVTQLIAAVLDPAVGRAVDRLALRPYRAGPFLAFGAVISAASFVTLYALPLLMVRAFEVAVLLILAVRFGISLLEVPYNALLPQVSQQSRARTSIAILKFGFSTVAVLVLSTVVDLVLASSAWHMLAFGALCGLLGSGSVMLAWWWVRDCDRLLTVDDRAGVKTAPLSSSPLRALWHREYALLFVVLVLTPFTTQLFIKSLAHRAIYVMGDPGGARDLLVALMVGQVPGLLLWDRVSKRLTTARATALAFAVVALGFILLAASASALHAIVATVVIGLGAAGALSMVWSLAADCADRARLRSGQDQASTAFGLLTFAAKAGAAFATLLLGWGLSVAGMRGGEPVGPQAVAAIGWFNAVLPAAFACLCGGTLLAYERAGSRSA